MASPHYPNSVSPSLHQGQKRSTGVEREGLIRRIDLVRGKIRVAIRWHGSGSGLNLGDSNNSNVATQSSVAWQAVAPVVNRSERQCPSEGDKKAI